MARPWIWVEPISLAASTTPGQSFLSLGMLAELGAADRGADAEAAVLGVICRSSLIFFRSTTRSGSIEAGAQLHQQVGAARQDAAPDPAPPASRPTAASMESGAS